MRSCDEFGCVAETEDALSDMSWYLVGESAYCALHGPQKAYAAKRAELRESLQRREHTIKAKQGFTSAEYAKWNEFQQDLVNYHKKTGKLAPKPLRLMNPFQWLYLTKKRGPIDVESEVARMDQAKADAEAKIRASLRDL